MFTSPSAVCSQQSGYQAGKARAYTNPTVYASNKKAAALNRAAEKKVRHPLPRPSTYNAVPHLFHSLSLLSEAYYVSNPTVCIFNSYVEMEYIGHILSTIKCVSVALRPFYQVVLSICCTLMHVLGYIFTVGKGRAASCYREALCGLLLQMTAFTGYGWDDDDWSKSIRVVLTLAEFRDVYKLADCFYTRETSSLWTQTINGCTYKRASYIYRYESPPPPPTHPPAPIS
jgi:hypothetical protein